MASPDMEREDSSLLDDVSDETTDFVRKDKMESPPVRGEQLVFRRQLYTQTTLDEAYKDQKEPKTTFEVIKSACKVSPQCVGRHALGYIPIVRFIRSYKWREWVVTDLLSGLSSAFIQLPQGLGFGILASLTPVYGLYSSFFPLLVYLLCGTSPHITIGTNAVISLLTANLVDREIEHHRSTLSANVTLTPEEELQYKVGVAGASCFVAGLILLGMGVLKLGFITNFFSKSFISAFTFSAAVHIGTSQVVKMLHLSMPNRQGMGKIVMTYVDIFTNIRDVNPADVILGVICMAILLAVKIGINERYAHKLKMPIPIELIVVIISTVISYLANFKERFGMDIVDNVPTGIPAPGLPDMNSLSRVATDSFIIAILIFAITISLAKLTAKIHDITIDDSQELVAYGLCQLVGAFFQNFPMCTTPPRTMVLSAMKSKTTLNGVSAAVFILLVLLVAGTLFEPLPIAMLAAMVLVAMKDLLLQIRNLRHLWHVNKADCFIWILTAAFSVLGDLDVGLLVGVVFSMVTVLAVSQLAKGTLLGRSDHEDVLLSVGRKGISTIPGVRVFRFETALYFASQERFRQQLYRLVLNPTDVNLKKAITIDDSTTHDAAAEPTDTTTTTPTTPTKPTAIFTTATSSDDNKDDQAQVKVVTSPSLTNGQPAASDVIRHVILDCSAMTYVDMSGCDTLQHVALQLSRVGVEVWLAAVPTTSLMTLHRGGVVEKIGQHRIFYSVMDVLQHLRPAPTHTAVSMEGEDV